MVICNFLNVCMHFQRFWMKFSFIYEIFCFSQLVIINQFEKCNYSKIPTEQEKSKGCLFPPLNLYRPIKYSKTDQ